MLASLLGASAAAGADPSSFAGASADAAHAFFTTREPLVAADSDGSRDLYERAGNETGLVAVSPDAPAGATDAIRIAGASDDGTHVFFTTAAQLVSTDTDTAVDLYQRSAGVTTLVSTGPGDTSEPVPAAFNALSADGSHAFFSTSATLVAGDADGGRRDVYERSGSTTTLISTGPSGGGGAEDALFADLTPDGTAVAFTTAEALAPTDGDAKYDVYQRSGATTTLISAATALDVPPFDYTNTQARRGYAWIEASGAAVFFASTEQLAGGDTDSSLDIYRRSGGITSLVSVSPQPGGADAEPSLQFVSADGSRVVFDSIGALTAADDDPGYDDVYERSAGQTTLLSTGLNDNSFGGATYPGAYFIAASADAGHVFFQTYEDLPPIDRSDDQDIFDASGGQVKLLTGSARAPADGNSTNDFTGVADDGSTAYFTIENPLVKADRDREDDVYGRRDGALFLASKGSPGGNAAVGSFGRSVSSDGSTVIFSTADSLAPSDRDGETDVYGRRGGSTYLISTGPRDGERRPVRGTVGTPPGRAGRIVFARNCLYDPQSESCYDGVPGIYTVLPSGRAPRRISEDETAADPSYSPGGNRIVFASARDGDSDIYLMKADGTGVTRVTDEPGYDYEPRFLADGRILYTGTEGADEVTRVVDADGSDSRAVTESVGAASTDGKRIAVVRCPLKNCDVYLYRPSGVLINRLTRAPGDDLEPEFSPNGRVITFTSRRPDAGGSGHLDSTEVYLMRSDGSRQHRVTRRRKQVSHYDPSFSPSGRILLYVAFKSRLSQGNSSDLVVRSLRRRSAREVPSVGGDGYDFAPDWQRLPRK